MSGRRVAQEEGIALIVALGVLFVLSIVLASVIAYSGSNARSAQRSKAGQTAYSLAEAGLNDAVSQLAQTYTAATTVYDPAWVIASPGGGQPYAGGTAAWSATFAGDGTGYRGTWTITATGSVKNPTGPASNVTRTITAQIDAVEQPKTVAPPQIWSYVYNGATGSSCDMTIDNTVTFTSPLWMPGNLCLKNQGKILQPSSFVAVGGNVTIAVSGSIGTSQKRILYVYLAGSCTYSTKATFLPCNFNSPNTQVWATNPTASMPSGGLAVPTINWQDVYNRASPGPKAGCLTSSGTPPIFDNDTVLNDSVPTAFNLTPSSSYTCKAANGGELSWNATTKVLTVNGIVFVDGNVVIDTGNAVKARYSGSGSIYASGNIVGQNNSTLCATLSGSSCDWSSWQPGISDGILMLVSNGTVQLNATSLQGGLYATTAITVGQSSSVQGPMVTPGQITLGQSSAPQFPPASKVEVGVPGDTTPPTFMLGPLRNVKY